MHREGWEVKTIFQCVNAGFALLVGPFLNAIEAYLPLLNYLALHHRVGHDTNVDNY